MQEQTILTLHPISSDNTSLDIRENVPLHDKNWFRTGGAAALFSPTNNGWTFQEAVACAQAHTLDVFVLGSGANILISDTGFQAL